MATALNTPQVIADELLRVDQFRRIRIMAARTEARRVWGPLSERRNHIETALHHLQRAADRGAYVSSIIERCEEALTDLQHEIDEAMRQVAIRHRLFANDDETESFDDVDAGEILPAAEAARKGRVQ